MSGTQTKTAPSGPRGLAGYCWAVHPGGRGHCTRPPGHSGPHADSYTGRVSVTAASGVKW